MPKYWGKQIFTHGRFPEVGQKQKTEKKKKKERNTPGTAGGPGGFASAMRSWPLLLPTFGLFSLSFFLFLQLLLLTHFGEIPKAENFPPNTFIHNMWHFGYWVFIELWHYYTFYIFGHR